MFADLAICLASLILSSATDDRSFWLKETLLLEHPLLQVFLAIALTCGWHLSLVAAGFYRSHRMATQWQMVIMNVRGSLFAALCTMTWSTLHVVASGRPFHSTREVVYKGMFFWMCALTLMIASRSATRGVAAFLRRHGRNLRYVLVVGSNRRAVALAEHLIAHSSMGYRVVGFVDEEWHYADAAPPLTEMLIGNLASLPDLLRTLALDEVVVALPIASRYQAVRNIVAECRRQGITVRCEGSLFDLESASATRRALPLITLNENCWDRYSVVIKRLLDILVSSCALLILSPVFLLVALAVKCTSPGPTFFFQERVGLGKRRFKIMKFRTMVRDAERLIAPLEHLNQSAGPTFKLANDPRVTPVGKLLRKVSLDELPQFINVLLGDMSLVGPRPLPVRDYAGFSEDWHRRRFSVKPGITCLWQVMGRSSIGFDRWMELDMNYIDTWSIWLDLKILLQTIPVVLRGSGAV